MSAGYLHPSDLPVTKLVLADYRCEDIIRRIPQIRNVNVECSMTSADRSCGIGLRR